jgi:polar amino acid transport system permease protein
VWSNAGALGSALLVTFWITVASILVGTCIGVLLGTLSLSTTAWIRKPTNFVIDLFLALPVLVLIIWLYFCLPLLAPWAVLSGGSSAILGLGLSLSAFIAQIVKAGINGVPRGQLEVAYCTGMTRIQTVRHILLPQSLRHMWPPIVGQFITCYKMSTLASIVAVQELLHTGSNIIVQTYRPLEVYTAIAAIFVLTLWPLNYLAKKIEQTERIGGTVGF